MRGICSVVLALSLAVSARAFAADPRIVNGVYTSLYPSTGALLFGNDPDTAFTWCSGTLIGCDTFLTAAHCVCDTTGPDCQSLDPASRMVFLQHAGFFQLASIAVRRDFDFRCRR
jgi:secreted trypsin-like serine protease